MLSQEALQVILGIHEKVHLTPSEMADKLNITFLPFEGKHVDADMRQFHSRLKSTLFELKANIVPFDEALEYVPLRKRFYRLLKIVVKDIRWVIGHSFSNEQSHHYIGPSSWFKLLKKRILKKGIAVVVLGEQEVGSMPMELVRSFKENSVISILQFPTNIHFESSFHDHFETAMSLFAYHMSNIILGVNKDAWILYNFNASHPIYSHGGDFRKHILESFIPKIVAPISPHRFSEFISNKKGFKLNEATYESVVQDLVVGAKLFQETKLYPKGKKIDDLPFRSSLHKWIGKLHLDNRNGMSYGFLAKQIPQKIEPLMSIEAARRYFGSSLNIDRDYFISSGQVYIIIELEGLGKYVLRIPRVSLLSQRSGSDKTNINPKQDLIELSLENGRMYIRGAEGVALNSKCRPSFDTKVMLSHAVGNAIIATILKHFNPYSTFSKQLEEYGMGLAHWHGYLQSEKIPKGWYVHGLENPHVACSSPQSAIYALVGKLRLFAKTFRNGEEFLGDVHVEPQHGTNMTYPSIKALAQFLLENPNISVLGNKHLQSYNVDTQTV